MNRDERMGQEVAHIAGPIRAVVECVPCGIGIAVDIVGKRWGENEETDWSNSKIGHACKVTRDGLTPEQLEKIRAIQDELARWSPLPTESPPPPDPRLPPERDDEDLAS